MSIDTCLLTENGTSGTYWATLSADKRARYGDVGSERVYSRIYDWYVYYTANKDAAKSLVLEIQGKWDDTYGRYSCPSGFYSITITTMINGVFDPDAYHWGIRGNGWRRIIDEHYHSTISTGAQNRVSIIGLEVINNSTLGSSAINTNGGVITNILNNIIQGYIGLNDNNSAQIVANNLFIDCIYRGVSVNASGGKAGLYQNNLAVNNGIGFYGQVGQYTGIYPTFVNNCAIGNTTNWSSDPTYGTPDTYDYFVGLNNGGETGDTIWGVDTITGITTSDFANFSGGDFRPASALSKLVDAGIDYNDVKYFDLANNVRPNYENGAEQFDIGCFEFDHGFGLAPLTVTLEITNIVAGSELAIYKASDSSVIVAPQTVSGTSYSTDYTYTADTLVNIVLRNASGVTKYQPYKTQGNINENGLSVYVSQVEDTIAQ